MCWLPSLLLYSYKYHQLKLQPEWPPSVRHPAGARFIGWLAES
jgi:hypothetical protein